MDQEFVAYLRTHRERTVSRIALFRAGRCWTDEMMDGQRIDTTAATLITLEEHLEEIDGLLTKAGNSPRA